MWVQGRNRGFKEGPGLLTLAPSFYMRSNFQDEGRGPSDPLKPPELDRVHLKYFKYDIQ